MGLEGGLYTVLNFSSQSAILYGMTLDFGELLGLINNNVLPLPISKLVFF